MKKLILFVISSLTTIVLLAQDSTATLSAEKEKTTLTIAALYGTNIDYYGQVAEKQLPYFAMNATVRIPAGLYFSATGYHLFTDSLFLSATSLGAGYTIELTPKLTGDISYNHTFFPANSPFLQASSPNLASTTLAYQHLFKTALNMDVSFGKQTDYFTTLSNSKAFDFPISNNKALLSFTPEFALIAGTQQYYETYMVQKNNNGKGKNNGNGPVTISTTNYKKYGILSYNLNLPVSYNRASYLIEAAFKCALLGNNAVNQGDLNTFFTLSAYYQF